MKASLRITAALLSAACTVALSAGPILAGSPEAARESTKTAATLQSARRVRVVLHAVPRLSVHQAEQASAPALVAQAPQERAQVKRLLDDAGIRQSQRADAEEVLNLFPESCLEHLRTFVVSYDGSLQRRGYAGKTTVMVDGTVKEFQAVLLHEMSHFWDLSACLSGTPNSAPSPFTDAGETFPLSDPSVDFYRISWTASNVRRAESKDADFFSGYAASDTFEDLAESVTYVLLQPETARARALSNPILQRKYDWVMRTFPQTGFATGTPHWDGKTIPWDATRIAYTWK